MSQSRTKRAGARDRRARWRFGALLAGCSDIYLRPARYHRARRRRRGRRQRGRCRWSIRGRATAATHNLAFNGQRMQSRRRALPHQQGDSAGRSQILQTCNSSPAAAHGSRGLVRRQPPAARHRPAAPSTASTTRRPNERSVTGMRAESCACGRSDQRQAARPEWSLSTADDGFRGIVRATFGASAQIGLDVVKGKLRERRERSRSRRRHRRRRRSRRRRRGRAAGARTH